MTEASDVWPEPVEGAPLTARASAELALAAALREVSDLARSLVPTGPARTRYDGLLVADAGSSPHSPDGPSRPRSSWNGPTAPPGRPSRRPPARIRRRPGPTGNAGRALGERHRAGRDPRPAGDPDDPPVTVDAVIAELDAWIVRHREPGHPIGGEHPVSDALGRMDPLHELLHLAAVRRRLAGLHDGSAPPGSCSPWSNARPSWRSTWPPRRMRPIAPTTSGPRIGRARWPPTCAPAPTARTCPPADAGPVRAARCDAGRSSPPAEGVHPGAPRTSPAR
jgi:hypothetical protein